MKTLALILGWFILIVLGLAFLITLSIIAAAAVSELIDRITHRFKK